ncbi:hypothetical protein NZD85_01515 [Empedobacter stercoris]|uniref:hypothetical protein n=1 Tax=Empedobacter stercoris TaxID=1628248 RepID=UPI0021AE7950|nr:hypothetical protein [Empedobacter stercoris]UWX67303.1 hypothetical protein NZD85_01515 [Empedobacter stercoris]
MKHYIYSLFTFLFFFNCTENKLEVKQLTTLELSETSEFKDASEDKKQLFYEIKAFQKDLQSKESIKFPDYLDCPKRVEELDLSTKNTTIRTDVESNSFRLSTNLVKDNFELIYNELDLNIINEAIKAIPETEILANDFVSTNVKIGDCDYHTSISMKGKEVAFDIKSTTEKNECKKDQKWKFVSNGEILVLDHRKML